jgi:type II secretory pathway pseudopilin PulG
MIRLRALRCVGQGGARGFTVIEILIALAIVMMIAGALATVVEPARVAFDRLPAELDLQQRGRTAIDVIAQALRSAGKNVAATNALGTLSEILPVVSLSDPDASGEGFATLTVIGSIVDGAQGILAANQSASVAPVTLAATPCPNVMDVCGFNPGMTAVIADGSGHYDVFVVASTTVGSRMLTADRGFSQPYPMGSAVIEIDQYTFSLAVQTDGSFSLVRETAAGATQPMVDFVTALFFNMSDHQVDVTVTVHATESLRRILADRVFRTSVKLRNAS